MKIKMRVNFLVPFYLMKANELLNIIKKLYPTISCSYVLNKRKNNKNNICLSCQINKMSWSLFWITN